MLLVATVAAVTGAGAAPPARPPEGGPFLAASCLEHAPRARANATAPAATSPFFKAPGLPGLSRKFNSLFREIDIISIKIFHRLTHLPRRPASAPPSPSGRAGRIRPKLAAKPRACPILFSCYIDIPAISIGIFVRVPHLNSTLANLTGKPYILFMGIQEPQPVAQAPQLNVTRFYGRVCHRCQKHFAR